jgi:hypothetical protein
MPGNMVFSDWFAVPSLCKAEDLYSLPYHILNGMIDHWERDINSSSLLAIPFLLTKKIYLASGGAGGIAARVKYINYEEKKNIYKKKLVINCCLFDFFLLFSLLCYCI